MPPPGAPPAMGQDGTAGESSSPSMEMEEVYTRIHDRRLGPRCGADPVVFKERLFRHLRRLPPRYLSDLAADSRPEDVMLHWEILDHCAVPANRPVFHAHFLKCIEVEEEEDCGGGDGESEPCERMMEDLSLERRRKKGGDMSISSRQKTLIHQIIFSSMDKPKLLSRLTALLSEVGLNIREAHVYSTTDGFCLDVFVVDGWPTVETENLIKEIKARLTLKNVSPSNSTDSSSSEKILELQQLVGDCEIDLNMLTMGEKFASGSSADLYRATYNGFDVAVKILRISLLNNPSEVEFLQEVLILRSLSHDNILRFYGARTRRQYCIVTEYMPRGNLYDFLHKQNNVLDLTTILSIAISISKGMDYLHQNNIVHRDLKSANLLLGDEQVLKIADFGVSRLGSQEGQMTAETGTYRWMAPEIINHKPYDHKADVFSFAIVLWELATSKVPYDDMTPLQAALGVRQGFRMDIPPSVHPRLSKLIRRCWDEDPDVRPVFADIIIELEEILLLAQPNQGASRRLSRSRAKMQKKL